MSIIPGSAKVLNQYENVNTTYGGSKAMKAQSKWYTMQDIEDTINANKPYKVFTALLTQVGDSEGQSITSGEVEKGVTYKIKDDGGSGWDFTNVGAPNNDIDTYFIATENASPNSWGSGGRLDYDLGAPVATVLENTMGDIFMIHSGDPGEYGIGWTLPFEDERTWVTTTPADIDSGTLISIQRKTDESIVVKTSAEGSPSDDVLSYAPREIRVYN